MEEFPNKNILGFIPKWYDNTVVLTAKMCDLCVKFESFFYKKQCSESIVAMENSHLYYLTYTGFQCIQETFPEFNFILIFLLAKANIEMNQCLNTAGREMQHPVTNG